MPVVGRILPKPPVTWVAEYELTEPERDAWEKFLYRLKDGVVTTGLEPAVQNVLQNTFGDLYNIFHSTGVADY